MHYINQIYIYKYASKHTFVDVEKISWLAKLSYSSLPMHKMTNTDLNRILKSEEVQKALRPAK